MNTHFEYSGRSYKAVIKKFAAENGAVLEKDIITMPPSVATGYGRVVEVQPGIEALLVDVTFNRDIQSVRKAETEDYLLLTFTDSDIRKKFSFTVDGEKVEKEATKMASAFLTCTGRITSFSRPAGMKEKSVFILLTSAWLSQYLNIERDSNAICEYLSLKGGVVDMEPLNPPYRAILEQLFSVKEAENPAPLYFQNRLLQLVELFFTRLRENSFLFTKSMGPLRADAEKIQLASSLLSGTSAEAPPTINEIARTVGMSPTNLKKKFKLIFGMGLYEYYQHNRLQKARSMLETGRYSVKEAMLETGYQSASNFTLAFKKMFSTLPSRYLNFYNQNQPTGS
jgi:AraC-like DNA-binding protein